MELAIETKELTKKFKNTVAVNNVSLSIETDKIYGLLGRNGAGKTTLLNLITAQFLQTSGSIRVFGQEPFENSSALQKMCIVKERQGFIRGMRVREILDIASKFYPNWDNGFSLKLLKKFDLKPEKKYKELSRGMESMLGIIIGLSSRAEITIFDEPTLGLDAYGRELFYHILLEDYAENPRTIILSTHLIDEVSGLFEKIIIIDNGSIKMVEDADALREMAYAVIGMENKVTEFIKNKKVIYKEIMGRYLSAVVFEALSPGEKLRAGKEDVEISSVSMQKLFVYLTEKNVGEGCENE